MLNFFNLGWIRQNARVAKCRSPGKRCIFQHQGRSRADPCFGYGLVLFWDKMDTFLML